MRAAAGFTLIEVLVAVLVLAVGLIGGTAMQLHAMRTRHESALLSAAVQAAAAMADRIRANAGQVGTVYLAIDYDAYREPTPTAPPGLCMAGPCDRAALAELDAYELKRLVRTTLPAGRVRVCRDAGVWQAGRLHWPCSDGPTARRRQDRLARQEPRRDAAGGRGGRLRAGRRAGRGRSRPVSGSAQRCAGVGLVEMLVALTIGMLVTLASAAMLVTANGDYLHHGATVRLNDSGRYAIELVGQALRQAAYADAAEPGGAAPAAEEGAGIEGLDARSVTRTGPGIADARAASVNGSDVLAVRFGGAGTGSGDGSIVDCAGFAVGASQQGWSIFYVAAGDDGEAELRCKYRTDSGGWSADAVVRGIDSFQVLYGVDTDTPVDGVANRYLNATAVRALDDALIVAGASAAERERERRRQSYWHRVVAVRVALLLHGESATRAGGAPLAYDLFGAAYTAGARGSDAGTRIDEAALPAPMRARSRRLFEAAVLLRNRAGS